MKAITRPAGAVLLLVIFLATAAIGQQKRQAPLKPAPRTEAAAPAPTFDTLVPADTYIFYGEIRGVGQFIRSSSLNDLLEPALKLSGPPKEFELLVKWLNAHSEEVMTSRLLLATWPNGKATNAPEAVVAIEFPTAEEATKFAVSLNNFLPKIVPAAAPETSAENGPRPNTADKPKPPEPNFFLKRYGSLVVLTLKSWTTKKFRPVGSKSLAQDINFRTARNRFSSEPLFVYVDTKTIEREEEERRKHWEQERIEAQKRAEAEPELNKQEKETDPNEESPDSYTLTEQVVNPYPSPSPTDEIKGAPTAPDLFSTVFTGIASLVFEGGETHWPDGIGLALSYDGDSFDLRVLLMSEVGKKADALPFIPMLIAGPTYVTEAPDILPGDTELLLTMSLDLPQIYAQTLKPRPPPEFITSQGKVTVNESVEPNSPFAQIEKELKISIKDDLLPLLGPEIAIRLPIKYAGMLRLPSMEPSNSTDIEAEHKKEPVLAIAIKDREAVRTLMPKLIEALGFKGASAFAQTERREDTELVSFANQFAYAFVGNFLVFSGDPASTRYVVDSYLKHETLAADIQFRNSTRWQPRPSQGQLYISPALMESYRVWAESPARHMSDQTRSFMVRASSVAQPITYSLSNEGLGPLHEVHIPKSLILMAVAGIAGEINPPQTIRNERMAIGLMYSITYAEGQFKKNKGNGGYGTLEQLIDAQLVSKETIEQSGYRFELILSGDKFAVLGVPVEYGKSGTFSLFIDHTHILRGADHNGASATASDPPISN